MRFQAILTVFFGALAIAGCTLTEADVAPTADAGPTTVASEPQKTTSNKRDETGRQPQSYDPKVERYAKCMWREVPTTTANWWKAGKTFQIIPLNGDFTPQQLLLARIETACVKEGFGSGVPVYAQDQLLRRIEAMRPAVINPDKMQEDVLRCVNHFTEADGSLYELGPTLFTFRDGKDVNLTGFFVTPERFKGAKRTSKCQRVQSDGSLSDA